MLVADIDGVLSDASGRQHLLAGSERQWEAFFEASVDDPSIPEGIALVELLAKGDKSPLPTVLLTARPARLSGTTKAWLERHGVCWDLLLMRVNGDHRSSPEIKRDALADLRATGHLPLLAVDDDPRNAEMYWSENVPTVYVHSGYYDF